jgi:hypothetical protein
MLKRPLILKLFAFFLFIDPILRVILLYVEKDKEFDFIVILSKALALPVGDLFNFWFLFPLSGVLLLGVKFYSYIGFILIQFYSLYFHINYQSYSWPYLAETPSLTAYILLAINIIMVGYLLMPRPREIFFNKNMRWWERGSRYSINEPCFVKLFEKEVHGKVCDISFGGALLNLDEHIEVGNTVKIDFEIVERSFSINAKIVRLVNGTDDNVQYGAQFLFSGIFQKLQLKFLMMTIAKLDAYEKFR